jgi:hypothetical protein
MTVQDNQALRSQAPRYLAPEDDPIDVDLRAMRETVQQNALQIREMVHHTANIRRLVWGIVALFILTTVADVLAVALLAYQIFFQHD